MHDNRVFIYSVALLCSSGRDVSALNFASCVLVSMFNVTFVLFPGLGVDINAALVSAVRSKCCC